MRRVRSLVILSVVALAVGGCSDDGSDKDAAATTTTVPAAPTGPQNYTVIVDGPSTLGAENLVFGAYFPDEVKVRPGDTLTFDNRSSNDIHTVTFGADDRAQGPPTVLKNGQANPAVFGPCYTTNPPRPDMTCPPSTAGAPEYAGTGFWNSGVILPTPLPAEAGPKTTTLKLAAAIAPAAYTITCLLHPYMKSVLTVVGSDAERQSPAQVIAAADQQLGTAKNQAAGVVSPSPAPAANGANVVAGWSDKLVAVNRFNPETVSVKLGQTVTWKTASDWMPHTVSFQPPYQSPSQPNALLPTGVKSGGKFAGGVSHSGIFGPPPDGKTDTFTLMFTKAGKYAYLCLLHPGMAGTVEVS